MSRFTDLFQPPVAPPAPIKIQQPVKQPKVEKVVEQNSILENLQIEEKPKES